MAVRIVSSRAAVVVVWAVAAAALGASWWLWLTDLTYPGMPWQHPHAMADFRDTVWLPGRWLLGGGNPYDPVAYLAGNPGSQELDPYAPAWLLMAVPFALLPFPVAAAAYLVAGAALAVVMLTMLTRTADPRLTVLGVPVGLLWLTLWSPGRYALQQGGTFLVFIGWVLVMRGLTKKSAPWAAAGLALALLKPQFGLPLFAVLMAARHVRTAVNGVLVLAAVSVPAIVLCVIAAGGPAQFVGSIVELVSHASSPASSTGLLSPFNGRIDIVGLFGRAGVDVPGWAQLVVALAAVGLACALGRYAQPLPMMAGVAALTLLGLVHQPYDVVILLAPVVLALPVLAARKRTDLVMWALAAVPVLHLHRVSTLVLPLVGADLVDVVALACCAGVAVASLSPQRRRTAL